MSDIIGRRTGFHKGSKLQPDKKPRRHDRGDLGRLVREVEEGFRYFQSKRKPAGDGAFLFGKGT